MPNWCDNYLVFKGDEEKLKRVVAFCQGMDFNKIRPMPEQLSIQNGTFSYMAKKMYKGEELDAGERGHLERLPVIGNRTENAPYGECSADLSYLWTQKKIEGKVTKEKIAEADRAQDPKSQGDLYELGRIMAENVKNYGGEDWLEWRYANWGTKWNASEVHFENKGDVLEYDFDTPGSPPYEIIELIAKYVFELSGVEMRGSYYIEMCGNGEYELVKEGIKDIFRYDYSGDEMDELVLASISMRLTVDKEEYIVLPDNIDEENVLKKDFENKEALIAYVGKLDLKNKEFHDRLLKYAKEFDVTLESVEYYGTEGITDASPCEYGFSIRTSYESNSEPKEPESTPSSSKYSSFEELLMDEDKK